MKNYSIIQKNSRAWTALFVALFLAMFSFGYMLSARAQGGDGMLIQAREQLQTRDTSCDAACQQEMIRQREMQIERIMNESEIMNSGDTGRLMLHLNYQIQQQVNAAEMDRVILRVKEMLQIQDRDRERIASSVNDFVRFGTQTTYRLGMGERAGVLYSYQNAFGHLPEDESDWEDVLKIAGGRWPGVASTSAEVRARNVFRFIYKREYREQNQNDQAAVAIIAYGLRPEFRNLASERNALVIFRNIYGYDPRNASDWDMLRAIAYSGAKR